MELRHLRYVAAVAEHAHLGRAAAALRVAKQALSAQLLDVERELGVALFVRHPRGMVLTKAGEAFAQHARETLAAHARAVEHVRRLGTDRQVLRVGLVETGRGVAVFATACAAFRTGYPHATLVVDPAPYTRHQALVREGRLDVGLYHGFAPAAPDLAVEPVLATALRGALVPAGHAAAAAAALAPGDLDAVPLITGASAAVSAEVADELARLDAAGWRGRVAHEAEQLTVINGLVAAGAGWACVPDTMVGHAPPGTAYRPLAAGTGTPFDLYAVTRAGAAPRGVDPGADPLAAAFLAGLRQERDRAARDELAAKAPPA